MTRTGGNYTSGSNQPEDSGRDTVERLEDAAERLEQVAERLEEAMVEKDDSDGERSG